MTSADFGKLCLREPNITLRSGAEASRPSKIRAEELEIEDEVDVANAIDELERAGILSLNMADPGDDYICNLEFRQPLNPNQLLIPFTEFISA